MEETKIIIALTGDIMLGRLVNEVIHTTSFAYPWGNTLPLLKMADLRIINLECALTDSKEIFDEYEKAFYFGADSDVIETLKIAKIAYCSLANNHILDFKEKGLIDTTETLDKNRIKHAGAGKSIGEAEKPAFLEAKGIKIAVLSFTDNEPGFAATKNKAGANYTEIETEGEYFEKVKRAIIRAKKGSDLVVFSIHWGPNMRQRPSELFRDFAHKVIDFGVDIFHGHSAHIFQGVEVYKGKLIMYDAGDFIDDYYVGDDKNDQQLLFLVTASKNKIKKLEMIPVLISQCQVNLAEGEIKEQIMERMIKLSDEFGTEVGKSDNRLIIKVA